MHLLHLEDNIKWFKRTVEPELMKIPSMKIYHATNKNDALNILIQENIDFALLDLSVPLNEYDSFSESIEHGISVAWHIRNEYPGIPIMILTGESTQEAAEKFEEENTFTTYWDGQEKPLVKLRSKRKVDEVIEHLASISASLTELDAIELDYEKRILTLDNFEQRVIRLFCLKNRAIAAKIKALNDGLSSAKVLDVTLLDNLGKQTYSALVKIDDSFKVDSEKVNFQEHITKLTVGSFPTYINEFFAGCNKKKGIFFQFAHDYKKDFFDIFNENDERLYNIAVMSKNIFSNWIKVKSNKNISVAEIRRHFCTDEKFEQKHIKEQLHSHGIDIEQFESKRLNSNFCIQHADLHGMNILVSEKDIPLIIDYGDVRFCPSTIDPITLELSHYFHPKMASSICHDISIATEWFDDSKLSSKAKNPKTAIFLREWARENSFLQKDYVAGVYSYAIKQFSYSDTNKKFAAELVRSAIYEFN